MEKIFLIVFALGVIIFLYQIIKRMVMGIFYPFISFEGEVISRSFKTNILTEEDGTEKIQENYSLDVRMPNGSSRKFKVNSRLYNSIKEGDLVRKDRGSLQLKKVRTKKNNKNKKNKKKS